MPPVFVEVEPVVAGPNEDEENAELDIDQYDGVPRTRFVSQHLCILLTHACGLTLAHIQRYKYSHSTAQTW